MKRILIKSSIFIILCLVFLGLGYQWFKNKSEVKPGSIDIFQGASVRQVSDLLELNGIIDDANIFYYYIRIKQGYYEYSPFTERKFDVNFKPGKFNLESKDFETLIAELNEIDNSIKEETIERFVTLPEGTNLEEMSRTLESKGIVNAEVFLKTANNEEYYNELRKTFIWLPEYNSQKIYQLEGYLHANTYDFTKNMLPHTIIETMLNETNNWYVENKIQIINSGYSFSELLTLASVVEKESKFSKDRPKVAQVFYNRISKGMKLESDITAAYAQGEHKVFMTYNDIEIESPFNTYYVKGLPLGPINSPSKESFDSVLNPQGKDFKAIFFYARPNGDTFYAETFEEHEKNRLKYEKEWIDLIE